MTPLTKKQAARVAIYKVRYKGFLPTTIRLMAIHGPKKGKKLFTARKFDDRALHPLLDYARSS